MRPLKASVKRIGEGSSRIAKGELETRVVDMGLKKFRELARQFNMMGENLEQSFRQVAEKAKWELVVS
ncbi:HAMP domain-containing protein [Paenibacillus sp. Root444D2]|uniref:HAMP domain-containing protein n=1 Tax=Paenibacillus sp. Root444D2 TaxID=1736538 RepID=UPI00070F1B28|nr:HAMP domain-containing protein [Paenibacillus sp. Root444D2]KQX53915.1 hypothetical protein ASD40_34585 [Paenibacillus sp. Root444D2]